MNQVAFAVMHEQLARQRREALTVVLKLRRGQITAIEGKKAARTLRREMAQALRDGKAALASPA